MITTLHDPVVTSRGGVLEHRTQVTFAPGTLAPGEVSYRVDPGGSAVADPSVLPLVPAALVLACRLGQDLRVSEPLPPAIHHGARHVAELLHRWYGWRPAELIAPLALQTVRPAWAHRRRGRGVFFTRGIDSWGTVLDLLDRPKRQQPTHLVTVDNEVHLPQQQRDVQVDQTRAVAERLGLPLIAVSTDIRTLIDPHTDWGTATHGSVLAGIALLLRRSLSEVVISPTHWTPLLRPWGSHPELDPCWSLPGVRVVHHTGDEPRWQRVARVMAHPLAAESVLVCWQGASDRNCGRCEKCLRLMTSLEVMGQMERSTDRFDEPFDPSRIGPQLAVSPHPWCDTIDHLDHVGVAADPLRQRWEQVRVEARPRVWVQTRAIQPRVPVVAAVDDPARAAVLEQAARHLASLGVRVDHDLDHDGGAGPPEPRLVIAGPPGRVTAAVELPGRPVQQVPLHRLDRAQAVLLIDALGADPAAAVPFDPDGQEPPPVVAEPEGWAPEALPAEPRRR